MNEITIAEILNTANVKRWQIIPTVRQQTLAEHCYLVVMISERIAKSLFSSDRFNMNRELVSDWAKYHDIVEVVTGDIATPAKSISNFDEAGIFSEYDEIKAMVDKTPISDIVKIADLIEAIKFLELNGLGKKAKEVEKQIRAKLSCITKQSKANWPSLNWERYYEVFREIINA